MDCLFDLMNYSFINFKLQGFFDKILDFYLIPSVIKENELKHFGLTTDHFLNLLKM